LTALAVKSMLSLITTTTLGEAMTTTTVTAGQTVTFRFGAETLTGMVSYVSPSGFAMVLVEDAAPVMAGREVMVDVDFF